MCSHGTESAQAFVSVVSAETNLNGLLTAWSGNDAYVARAFTSARDFLAWFDGALPGCVVLDLNLDDGDGLELQRSIAELNSSLPVVFATSRATVRESVEAMRLGAFDFFVQPFENEMLLARVEQAVRIACRHHKLWRRYSGLSRRERQVLMLLIEHAGSLTSKQIARRLDLSPRTVEHYRSNLLTKMRAASVTELVVHAQVMLTGAGASPLGEPN